MARRTGSPLGARVQDAFMLAQLLDTEREAVEGLRQMSAREYHEAIASRPDRQPLSQATKDLLCVAGCGLDETPQFEDDEETVSEYGSERTQGDESEQDARGFYAAQVGGGDNIGSGRLGINGGDYTDHASNYAAQDTSNDRANLYVEGRADSGCSGGGSENIEDDHFGNDNVGNGNFGNDSVGNDNVGDKNFGNDNVGNDSVGNDNVGNNDFGDDNFGNNSVGNDTVRNDNVRHDNVGNDSVGNDNVGNDRYGIDGGGHTDDEVEVVPPPPPHLRWSGPKEAVSARSARNRQNRGSGHRGSKGGRAKRCTSPGSGGSGSGSRGGNGGGGGGGGGTGARNVYREPISGRTSAHKPDGGRPDIAVATRSTRVSTSTTVAMPAAAAPAAAAPAAAAPAATSASTAAAAAAAAGTAMVVPCRATAAMPRPDIAVATRSTRVSTSTAVATPAAAAPAATSTVASATAAAGTAMVVPCRATPAIPPVAPMPAAAEIAAGGASAMAVEAPTAAPIASNNLPFADVIFIDDAKWREKYLGGVFQPPVRRAAAKAMNKISEISVAAATAPASPRRKSTGISGGGRFGAAPRGATGAFGFSPSPGVESQRRHSISGGGSGGGGGGGGGGVDHMGAIVPQKRPGSPIMQGPISIQARGRDGSGEVSFSFELDPRLFLYMAPGACHKKGCVFIREAHCHRGPACDCVRNRDAYTIPRETARILEHQNEHVARNANPAVGKRVLVKFSDNVWYKGTITARKKRTNSAAAAAAAAAFASPGASGSGGYRDKWQIIFDDADTRTFYTGDSEVMISNQPLPHNLPAEVKALYRKTGNGRALLMADTKARAAALAEINADSDRGACTTSGAVQALSPPSAAPGARKQRCRRR